MPTFEQAIGAGGNINLPGGEVFYLLTATDAVDLTFYDKSNKSMDKWEGMKAGLNAFMFRDEKGNVQPFLHVNVYSATAQTVKVAISTARAVYQRSQGDVNVLSGIITTVQNIEKITRDDSWLYDTDQARACIGGAVQSNVAGQYSHVQLINPAASGKVAYVKRAVPFLTNAVAYTVYLKSYDTALASAGDKSNKIVGGTAPVCDVNKATSASILGTTLTSGVSNIYYVPLEFIKHDPIKLTAGKGLLFVYGVADFNLGAMFEWVEV